MDLSKVSMDDSLPLTPTGNIILEESDDSIESEADPKDDSVVLAQTAMDQPTILLTPSANPPNAEDPSTQDVQDLPPKGNEIPHDPPASWT